MTLVRSRRTNGWRQDGSPLIRPEALQFARKTLHLAESTSVQITPLGKRGSDRAFFRLAWPPNQTAILIDYDPKRQENCYHAAIAQFLDNIGVPVPHLFGHDPLNHVSVMRDLGEIDLWALKNGEKGVRDGLYEQTIAALRRLHSFPLNEFPSERVALMAPFDGQLYKWERDYFREHFVETVCHIQLDSTFAHALEEELSRLADRLIAGPQCLIHRDLQSQNIMICNGNPIFIDFQGMRFGSPFYDLGSFLCDPYVEFTEKERERYLSLYYCLSNWGFDWETFKGYFWEASVQRLMQALGAYGFLGFAKGLDGFLKHIPSGMQNLEIAASHCGGLPQLRGLIERCRAAWTGQADQPEGITA